MILALCLGGEAFAATGGQENADFIPSLVPAAGEIPVLTVPPWPLHMQLNDCLESAKRVLADPVHAKLHACMSVPFITLNQKWGSLLRADFTRDDVAPPQINRILCWADGQLIASKLSAQPLASIAEYSRLLAVPGARPH
jgi:hypothetical protein